MPQGLLDLFTGGGGLLGGQTSGGPQQNQGGNLGAAFQNFAAGTHGGLLSAIGNAITGATTGQRTDPLGLMQQQQQATEQALLGTGIHPALARAAALNPEIMKTIASSYLDLAPKLQKTGTDPFTGQDTFAWVNPQRQTLTPAIPGQAPGAPPQAGTSGGAPGTSMAKFSDAVQKGVSGEDLYDYLPPGMRPVIKNMIEGRSAPPGQYALRSPQVLAMIQAANAIDPQFDATTWTARNNMIKQLNSTAPNTLGGQLNIGNTAVDHLMKASRAAADLGNVDLGFGFLTRAANTIKNTTTTQQAKIAALQDAAQHYGQEITRFYAGGPGGEAERARFLASLDGAKSPQEIAQVLATEADLMRGRIKQYETQIGTTLGPSGLEKYPVIRPEAEQAFDEIGRNVAKMRGQGAPSAPAAGAAAQAAPMQPTQKHIDLLRANPGKAQEFNQKFGPGAAERILGGA